LEKKPEIINVGNVPPSPKKGYVPVPIPPQPKETSNNSQPAPQPETPKPEK